MRRRYPVRPLQTLLFYFNAKRELAELAEQLRDRPDVCLEVGIPWPPTFREVERMAVVLGAGPLCRAFEERQVH